MSTLKVVALGGLHASLSALRRVTTNLTAIVTVADDGGSGASSACFHRVICGWRSPCYAGTTSGARPGSGWSNTGSGARASSTRSATC